MEMTTTTDILGTERIRPLKRVEYDRLATLGYFQDERVELLFGVVVEMAPNDPAHAETTDRGVKAPLYGASAVDEYWIVAVDEGFVEVFRDPKDGHWESKSTHHRGDVIGMIALPNVAIAVSDLLPPAE